MARLFHTSDKTFYRWSLLLAFALASFMIAGCEWEFGEIDRSPPTAPSGTTEFEPPPEPEVTPAPEEPAEDAELLEGVIDPTASGRTIPLPLADKEPEDETGQGPQEEEIIPYVMSLRVSIKLAGETEADSAKAAWAMTEEEFDDLIVDIAFKNNRSFRCSMSELNMMYDADFANPGETVDLLLPLYLHRHCFSPAPPDANPDVTEAYYRETLQIDNIREISIEAGNSSTSVVAEYVELEAFYDDNTKNLFYKNQLRAAIGGYNNDNRYPREVDCIADGAYWGLMSYDELAEMNTNSPYDTDIPEATLLLRSTDMRIAMNIKTASESGSGSLKRLWLAFAEGQDDCGGLELFSMGKNKEKVVMFSSPNGGEEGADFRQFTLLSNGKYKFSYLKYSAYQAWNAENIANKTVTGCSFQIGNADSTAVRVTVEKDVPYTPPADEMDCEEVLF